MFIVYILYSFSYNKLYTGYTSNLIQRFYSHNLLGDKNWTCRYRPWVVIYTEIFEHKSEAIKRENELKSGKGRDWISMNIDEWKKVFA
ncbi:MAG: GIY-YIG nuclease family protein [Sphingobacteriales bacterium]